MHTYYCMLRNGSSRFSILSAAVELFNLHNPSARAVATEFTDRLTEMSVTECSEE
jgi:hypothetical protein